MNTVYELVKAVREAFVEMPMTKVAECFATLQNVLRDVQTNGGSNLFKIPRKRKYAAPLSDDEMSLEDSETETEFKDSDDTQTKSLMRIRV